MKIKKLLACLLAATAAFSAFGCGKVGGANNSADSFGGIPAAKNPQNDFQAHYVENMLHDVNVDFTSPANETFIRNKQSDYVIVNGKQTAGQATALIGQQLSLATGCILDKADVEDVTTVDQNSTYILVGCDALFAQAGLEMPSFNKIGNTGYYIVTYGKNVFIQAYGEQGYQLAGIAFLREVIGYEAISMSITAYEKDGTVLPQMEITERPDFDYRQQDKGRLPEDVVYEMGFTSFSVFRNTGTSWMHNVVDYIGGDVKTGKNDGTCEEHRSWFSDDAEMTQGCFTARGDKEEYALMVEHYVDKVLNFMKVSSTENIVIGQMDVIGGDRVSRCGCAACDASFEYYGSSYSGATLSFLNDVSAGVDAYLASDQGKAEFGENRTIHIIMLVYGAMIRPPIEMGTGGNYAFDENGKGIGKQQKWFNLEEDGTITVEDVLDENGNPKQISCGENVELLYCPASANYVHSFYEAENASFSSMVQGWAGLGGSFYVWLYEVNFFLYLYPYNSWDSMLENMRYFKNTGANHLYYQGLYENTNNAAFDTLRTYICSKGLFDVNVDYEELLDKYFKYQYGPAGNIMREYFDQITQQCRAMESYTGGGIHSYDLANKIVWPEGLLRHWIGMLDDAFAAIAPLAKTDPSYHETLRKNILVETIFPRYVLCTEYANTASFSAETLREMRRQFVADFNALGMTTHQEHTTIADVFNAWDLG